MTRVLVDGSSSAYGLWGGPGGGWADRLKSTFMNPVDRRQYASVVNFALPLRILPEIVEDLPANMQRCRGNSPKRIGAFMVGMSESRRIGGQELAVSEDQFKLSLAVLSAICRAQEFEPVFVGLPPFDESRTQNFGREHDQYNSYERTIFDGIVRSHAEENKHVYVDTASALSERYPNTTEILDVDGLHLNAIGHAAVHDVLVPIIQSVFGDITERSRPQNSFL